MNPAMTPLETAALHSIFSETEDLIPDLEAQFAQATVVERENTGGGFLTTFAVGESVPRLKDVSVLGYETAAEVTGLPHGVGFALLLRDGVIHLLDCHAWAASTSALDPFVLDFRIFKQPAQRID